jgi:hypothetical protein
MNRWIEIEVERTLTVDRGRDVILCDRSNAPQGETLLVLMSDEAIEKMCSQIERPKIGKRRGGAKGGHARSAALSPERRSEIARAGADARWGKGETS